MARIPCYPAAVFLLALLLVTALGLLALICGAAWIGFQGGRTGAGLRRTCGRAWAVGVRNITVLVIAVTLFIAIMLINREDELALFGYLLEWVLPGVLALCVLIAAPSVLASLIAYNIGAQGRTREALATPPVGADKAHPNADPPG